MNNYDEKNGGRPTVFFNHFDGQLSRRLSNEHDHDDFGKGYDIYYKDVTGKKQAELHGLTPEEAQYLKSIKSKW